MREKNYYINILCSVKVKTKKKHLKKHKIWERKMWEKEKRVYSHLVLQSNKLKWKEIIWSWQYSWHPSYQGGRGLRVLNKSIKIR